MNDYSFSPLFTHEQTKEMMTLQDENRPVPNVLSVNIYLGVSGSGKDYMVSKDEDALKRGELSERVHPVGPLKRFLASSFGLVGDFDSNKDTYIEELGATAGEYLQHLFHFNKENEFDLSIVLLKSELRRALRRAHQGSDLSVFITGVRRVEELQTILQFFEVTPENFSYVDINVKVLFGRGKALSTDRSLIDIVGYAADSTAIRKVEFVNNSEDDEDDDW